MAALDAYNQYHIGVTGVKINIETPGFPYEGKDNFHKKEGTYRPWFASKVGA